MKTTAQVLRDALALLGPNGERWIKGTYGMGGVGPCCAEGAVMNADDPSQAMMDALGLLRMAVGEGSVVQWNDEPARTWPEVKAAFEKAIALAETGAQP